jgi:haloalkane dehalogenase
MAEYRRPFLEVGEVRRPTLSWPREMPLDGEPADVVEVVRQYGEFLRTSPVSVPESSWMKWMPGTVTSCLVRPGATEFTHPARQDGSRARH